MASTVCLALAWAFSDFIRMPPREETQGRIAQKTGNPEVRQKLYAVLSVGLTDGVLHGWLATFIYVHMRNARIAARALAEAEIRRSEANRKLFASQLEATHAEVDPDEVLLTLESIRRAYETDPAAADARMDQLIAPLRPRLARLRPAMSISQAASAWTRTLDLSRCIPIKAGRMAVRGRRRRRLTCS